MAHVRALAWPAAALLGAAAEWTAFDHPGHALADLATGWMLLACGLLAWSRRPDSRTGPLLAAAGAAWFAGNFTAAALYLHRGPLVHALLAYPSGRARSPRTRVAVALGYAAALVVPVWASEPAALALSAGLALAALAAYREAVGAERRARAASLAAALALALVLGLGAAARLAFPAGDADAPALFAYQLVLCAAAIGLSAPLISRAPQPAPLADLVVELGESRSETLRDALARALGDPTLEVGFWVPGAGEYIDASGRSLALPEAGSARALTKVDGAALVHDPAVLGDPLLSDSVAAAARLAAANARLHAALTAQVDELEASRRRLLAAADDERRRLEQRLRDGVERRLAALADRLERDGTAGRARELLARTRADLRELARGLHPTSDTGLAGALAELAGGSAVPVELAVADGRVDAEAEAAAYFVCAEALANATKHAAAGRVVIAVRRDDARLTVEVADDGAGGADAERGTGLRGLADRLEARGGRLLVDSPAGGGTRLVAEIPLSRSSATA